VDYDRKKCEEFVQRVLFQGDQFFVRFWMHANGMVDGVPLYQLDAIYVEWYNMSLWNKQAVLFLMIPPLCRMASDKAQEACGLARQQEPL
jgi:hypothetical protein